jgi:hypothetical protein
MIVEHEYCLFLAGNFSAQPLLLCGSAVNKVYKMRLAESVSWANRRAAEKQSFRGGLRRCIVWARQRLLHQKRRIARSNRIKFV